MENVLEYLEKTKDRFPDKTAVIDDKEKCSYKELWDISRCIGIKLSE